MPPKRDESQRRPSGSVVPDARQDRLLLTGRRLRPSADHDAARALQDDGVADRVVRAAADHDAAVIAEAVVETAEAADASDAHTIVPGRRARRADGDDLRARRHGEGRGLGAVAREHHEEAAEEAEVGVRATVRLDATEEEVFGAR